MSVGSTESASSSAKTQRPPIGVWLFCGALAAIPWVAFSIAPEPRAESGALVVGFFATAAFLIGLLIMFGIVFAREFSASGKYEPGFSAIGVVSCCLAAVVGWFAALYVQTSAEHHDCFLISSSHRHVLRHAEAAYFTLLTLTTAGTGDISPTSKVCRLAVSGQSLLGLAIIALLIAALASRILQR
jgi:Ion channel